MIDKVLPRAEVPLQSVDKGGKTGSAGLDGKEAKCPTTPRGPRTTKEGRGGKIKDSDNSVSFSKVFEKKYRSFLTNLHSPSTVVPVTAIFSWDRFAFLALKIKTATNKQTMGYS